MDLINFSVPGNLLLMGEYSILEEGGLGLSIAISERAYFTLKRSNKWRFFSKKTKAEDFVLVENEDDFVFKMFRYLKQRYFIDLEDVPCDVYIDTSVFFLAGGVKKGFGSSAVVAVGVVCGIFLLTGDVIYPKKDKIFTCCLEAYRYAQGGMGSGYDIVTSIFGGVVQFKGGNIPTYKFLKKMDLSDFYLMQGSKGVKTTSAIIKYGEHRASLIDFIESMNNVMREIVPSSSNSYSCFLSSLEKAKKIGLEIGKRIGVSADLPLNLAYLENECALIKALGAGNETFLVHKPNFEVFDQFNLSSINLDLDGVRL
ncbi:phosphomevalonate kinase [Borrelia sp. BU AG58]|uniref:GHMP family kinase ATP-binding protein n=1 Tax=Borrelia sp. BU AG58 TaxID=2887345 RepID=UPI001E2A2D3A|nr:phosphomevalonate kinase [Borrelia sp. BU AG58]UER67835.1 phosphomevalonate kinase [Borrelia sp. BU AG58]